MFNNPIGFHYLSAIDASEGADTTHEAHWKRKVHLVTGADMTVSNWLVALNSCVTASKFGYQK